MTKHVESNTKFKVNDRKFPRLSREMYIDCSETTRTGSHEQRRRDSSNEITTSESRCVESGEMASTEQRTLPENDLRTDDSIAERERSSDDEIRRIQHSQTRSPGDVHL